VEMICDDDDDNNRSFAEMDVKYESQTSLISASLCLHHSWKLALTPSSADTKNLKIKIVDKIYSDAKTTRHTLLSIHRDSSPSIRSLIDTAQIVLYISKSTLCWMEN